MFTLKRTIALAAGPLVLACVLAGCGGTAGDPAAATGPCGPATVRYYLDALGAAGARIYGQERHSTAVDAAIYQAQHDEVLIKAVERRDVATIHQQILRILYDHLHIVRMRVVAGGQLLGDVGGRHVLDPIHAALRDGTKTIGGVALSIQDDVGYLLLAHRFIDADVVLHDGRRVVMSSLRHPPASIPMHGELDYFGRRYGIFSYHAVSFPGGPLTISLLLPLPPLGALPAEPCQQVVTDTIGRVVQHAYREATIGASARQIRAYVGGYAPLRTAVRTRDVAQIRAAVTHLVNAGHATRLRVTLDGAILADTGPTEMVAPVPGRFPGIPGRFTFAVQTPGGFVSLAQALTGADVVIRSPAGELAGTIGIGSGDLPEHGEVDAGGVVFDVFSFPATAFDGSPLRVYVLVNASQLRAVVS